MKHMMALLAGGAGFTALAGLAMLLKMHSERIAAGAFKNDIPKKHGDRMCECLMDARSVQDVEVVQVASIEQEAEATCDSRSMELIALLVCPNDWKYVLSRAATSSFVQSSSGMDGLR